MSPSDLRNLLDDPSSARPDPPGTLQNPPSTLTSHRSVNAPSTVPWFLWCAALAVTSAYVGGYWDISWHRSIGRDSFWTAPHLAIYACGVLAGISSAYLIFGATFGRARGLREASVRIWGLSGPLGAFISAWGGVAMLASAPFDDWWHNAYGLDVRIISPPHMVLAMGFFGIQLGTLLLMLAFMNRASGGDRRALEHLFLYVGGVAMSESLLLKLEYIDRSAMHSALFYVIVAIGTPLILTAVAVASRHRWACTIMAGVYTAFAVAFLWILPLVPAEPKLGPVYRQVTHLIPWEFPLLLLVPAIVTDLLLQRSGGLRPLLRAPMAGAAFLATFVAVQWPFASFMMTPPARNWFFGAHYMDFSTPPRSAYARFVFAGPAPSPQLWRGLLLAAAVVMLMMWLGIHAGRAMQRVRR
jgi:hypothetical protein